MMLHPDHMMVIVRQHQEELLAGNESFVIFAETDVAIRFARRQIGLTLIRLGTWLGGHAAVSTPPARLSSPDA